MGELRYFAVNDIEDRNINIYGRLGRVRQPLPLLFNGSAVEIRVSGSDLWIEVETDNDFHEPWVAYELNGALMG